MNWESFVPDLLVGLVTGGLIALVVLGLERRISARARRAAVTDAQWNVVEVASRVLKHEITFPDGEDEYLRPDTEQLDRVLQPFRSVPHGRGADVVPGFAWIRGMVNALDELDSLADAIESRLRRHRQLGWNLLISHGVHRVVESLAAIGPPLNPEWEWDHPDITGLSTSRLSQDLELRALVRDYLNARWFLLAYREAFLDTSARFHEQTVAALTRKGTATPGRRVKNWLAMRKYYKEVAASQRWVDLESVHIVTKVGPIEGI